MFKVDLQLPTGPSFAGTDRHEGWKFLAVVAAVAETVVAKASETEAVVQRQRKQRECLHGEYVGGVCVCN